MTNPVYKIETLTGAVSDHVIEDGVISLYCKEVVTDGVGTFSFTVPTVKGIPNPYYYDDIAKGDTVKIWLGYDSISGDPNFVGKVTKISGLLSKETGYVRQISGLSQGEILLRRQKKNKIWDGVGASTIVTDIANDLSLGTGDIESDSTSETIEVETKRYFDILKEVSDYWYSAGSQVKKDFYVDIDNDLVWKSRPFRTTGVESLTIGDNIVSYRVTRPVEPVKNDIYVYGAAERPNPTDKDSWTESTTDWTSNGTLATDADAQVGSYSINALLAATSVYMQRGNIGTVSCKFAKEFKKLHVWFKVTSDNVTTRTISLYAPNSSNKFTYVDEDTTRGIWQDKEYLVGRKADWTQTGSPDWENIQTIRFEITVPVSPAGMKVDGLYFGEARYYANVSDATSQSTYLRRDLEHIDDKLHSNSDCDKRGNTLLYQLKDPPTQIDVAIVGNTNVLVGDRIPMTIPAENISTQNFDVISVEHSRSNAGFFTNATMVDTANIRAPVVTNSLRALVDLNRRVRELSLDEVQIR